MLEIHISSGNIPDIVEAAGSGSDIIAELCFVVNQLYSGMLASSPAHGRAFMQTFIKAITDPDGPTWKPDKNIRGTSMIMPKVGGLCDDD